MIHSHIFTNILIAASISVLPLASLAYQRTDPMDLEPYVGAERLPQSAKAMQSMPDGKSFAALSDDCKRIIVYDIESGKEISTLVDLSNTRENKIDNADSFIISQNGAQVLIATATRPIYRRSRSASYYVYEVRSRLLRPLSVAHSSQREPLFSPDGSMVAFVAEDNNIYLKKLSYWTEVAVTSDGVVNQIINGVPDWTYEEEFSTSLSMAWAPDSRTLCYLKYNETDVPSYSLTMYEGTCDPKPEFALYPGQYSYKYPVAGKPNSIVSLHSYDIDNRKTKDISLPDQRIEYIPRIAFGQDADHLMTVTLNRAQNRMEIYDVNPRSAVAKSILVEQSEAWLNPMTYENIAWQPDGFVILSGRSGFDHLYRYAYNGSLTAQLTKGDYDVTDYYGFDSAKGFHYYQSTSSGSINRVVSRVDRQGRVADLSASEGTASAHFISGMDFYTLSYSNATTPPVTTLFSATSGKRLRTIVDNSGNYAHRYADMPKREFIAIPTDGNIQLNAYIIKPAGFDPSKRYPVVMYQYSGPGSQEVKNVWSVDWTNYFALKGYVVICCDGRGTGFRGRKFMDVVYRNLGHYETIDQLAAARFAASLPYVDSKRIGLHGWSYGGYETLMCVGNQSSPWAAAVAVAPVSDWRFYDSIYAERYMLTPGENSEGYRRSSALEVAANVKCPLLIMYGTADDNVHPENTIAYVGRMEADNNYCDLLLFPNMNHSINGCGVRRVVYARMFDYFNIHMR